VKDLSVVCLLSLTLACKAKEADNRATRIMIGANSGQCESYTGKYPDSTTIGHWFANDARARLKTFGSKAPDSSAVSLVLDSTLNGRASRAFDSTLFANWAAKERPGAKKIARLRVYRADRMYAVLDANEQTCGGDRPGLPSVFFFDTSWRFLGYRSI
jgi:hypothetical protein